MPANDADVRGWLTNKGFKDPGALFKDHRDLETQAAQLRASKGYPATIEADGSIKAGDENAVRAWRQAVGVPEKPEGYNIPIPKDAGFPQLKDAMAKVFHDAGVPPAMGTRIAIGFNTAMDTLEKAYKATEDEQSAAGLQTMRDEWGANFGERASIADRGWRLLQANFARFNLGTDGKPQHMTDVQKRILEASLGTPMFMKIMHALGAGNAEGRFAGDPNNAGGGFAPGDDIQAQIDQMNADRISGKISDAEWKATGEAKMHKLLEALMARDQRATASFAG